MPAFTRRQLLASLTLPILATPSFASPAPEIEIMGSPYIKEAHEAIRAAFAEQRPDYPARLRFGPPEDDVAIQQILRAALIKEGVPDVIVINGNLMRLLADRGLAVALDPLIAKDGEWNGLGFTPAVAAAGQIAGKTFGMAFGLSLPVVLFNASLVRRAGHDQAALPEDWPGILALAQKIEALDPTITGGFMEYDSNGAFGFLSLINSFGAPAMSADEKALGFANEKGKAALGILRGFAEAGQGKADMTRQQARQAFGAGAVGILVTMSSTISAHEKAAAGHFDVLSAPYPLAPDGWLPTAGPIAVMLTQDPDRQKAAFDYMKFAASAEAQTILATKSGYVPVNEIAIRESGRLGKVLSERKNAHAYLDRIAMARNWYAFPGANSVKICDRIKSRLQEVATLQATPEAALAGIGDDVMALLG